MSGATDHLPRLLALVPWLLAHPDTSVAEVAKEFGVGEAQIRADVNLLWMCGLPGYGPGDLIDVEWRGDRVTLWVEDDGAGIDDAAKRRIFDAFYTTRAHGAGIGLAVVKRIIDDHARHGASIAVENGQGGESAGARSRRAATRAGRGFC